MRMAVLILAMVAAACQPQVEAPVAETPAAAPVVAPPVFGGVDFAQRVRVSGTEPFWGVDVTPETLVFTGVDRAESSTPNPGVKIEGETAVIAAADVGLTITLRVEQCSDGMSDRVYALKADVVLAGEALSGCADSQAALDAQPKP